MPQRSIHAARWHAQSLFQPDDRPQHRGWVGGSDPRLTGKTGGQAWGLHRRYEEQEILAPLLTFRGAGFEAAILDERGSDPGFPGQALRPILPAAARPVRGDG